MPIAANKPFIGPIGFYKHMLTKRNKLRLDGQFRAARLWSNRELQKIAGCFDGNIINVSAGEDIDKEGRCYRDYFSNACSYSISNYPENVYRGYQGKDGEIQFDLESELPERLTGAYNVVFNHTTLEHVFDVRKAFSNLCALSNDIVIIVVPFCQVHHETAGYSDYWRFTPTCLKRLFAREGFSVINESCGQDFNASVYIFMVASRRPSAWSNVLPQSSIHYPCGEWIGKQPPLKQVMQMMLSAIMQILKLGNTIP